MLPWKEFLARYFTNLVSVLTLIVGVVFAYDYYQNKELEKTERKLLEERYGKLVGTKDEGEKLENATQLTSLYKEQLDIIKEAKEAWRELAKEREERIKLMSNTTISVPENVEEQEKSDYEYKTPNGTDGYLLNELRIEGKDSPPIGYVMIRKDGRTYKKNYKFEIRVENVQFKDDLTGKIRVVARAFLVPLENGLADSRRSDLKKWEGEQYPLEVSGGEVVIDPQEPITPTFKQKEFIFWPLNINAGFGLFSDAQGNTGSKFYGDTNLLGYGLSKRDLDWKFLHVGVNYSDIRGIGFQIMPFTYRLFPSILTNTYAGVGYSFDNIGSGYFLGVSTGL